MTQDEGRYRFRSSLLNAVTEQENNTLRNKSFSQARALVDDREVSRSQVVQVISELMKIASSPMIKLSLVHFIHEITTRDEQEYPELFWVILDSQILFEAENDISVVGRLIAGTLIDIGGREAMRAYLTYILLTQQDENKIRKAAMAFYPTGHTVSSLQILDQVISASPSLNLDINYVWLSAYLDAEGSIFKEGTAKLSAGEKEYLKGFFTRGLSLPNEFIHQSSQKALALLEEKA